MSKIARIGVTIGTPWRRREVRIEQVRRRMHEPDRGVSVAWAPREHMDRISREAGQPPYGERGFVGHEGFGSMVQHRPHCRRQICRRDSRQLHHPCRYPCPIASTETMTNLTDGQPEFVGLAGCGQTLLTGRRLAKQGIGVHVRSSGTPTPGSAHIPGVKSVALTTGFTPGSRGWGSSGGRWG